MNLYSIIIPIFNSDISVERLVDGIVHEFENNIREDYEIILVDDSSTNPNTKNILRKLNSQFNKVTSVFLSKNFGQHSALLCGMKEAKGNYIITMDDDLQHSPLSFGKLIEQKDHQVVYAKFKNIKSSLIKKYASIFRNFINHITLGSSTIYLSSFVLYQRTVIDNLLNMNCKFPIMGSLVCQITDDIVNVELEHRQRFTGRSGYTIAKIFSLFTNILFNNSKIFVKTISYTGLIFLTLSIVSSLFLFFNPNDIKSSYFLILLTIIFFIACLLAFFISIIAEYLRRILNTLENKPLYVIKEKLEKRTSG